MQNKTIGLFFGSFNPVHIGHMAIANYFVEFAKLEELWFVVSPQNPLKEKLGLLPERQRLYMIELAIGKDYRFKTCDIEFSLPKPSYTVNTLTYLREKYPHKSFSIIMGGDNLANFHKWKNFNEILRYHNILVYPRPNFTSDTVKESYNATWVDAPLMEIAASDLRKAIACGHDLKYFFPEKVWDYIDSMNFFK